MAQSVEKQLTDSDYVIVTRAWFRSHNKDLTIDNIREECEIRSIPNILDIQPNLRKWMIHFGKEAVQHSLVSLRRPHSLTLYDVIICHK